MRKIIVSSLLSVDGLISGPGHEMTWTQEIMSDELLQELKRLFVNVDTILLGRITYRLMHSYCMDPLRIIEQDPIAHYFNRVSKFVFSRTLTQPEWNNTLVLRRIDRRTIHSLQRKGNGNIAVIGSASIVRTLINLDMVNEFHFFVHPLVLGKGKPLFQDIRYRHTLMPVRTTIYKNGVLQLSYQAFTGD
jgi:dihydrofolate reductase